MEAISELLRQFTNAKERAEQVKPLASSKLELCDVVRFASQKRSEAVAETS
jgi:hypothetical protein